jgi:hypothetical protein
VNKPEVIHALGTEATEADTPSHQRLAELCTVFRPLLMLLVFINEERIDTVPSGMWAMRGCLCPRLCSILTSS